MFYASRLGRPSLRPGRYFRLLFIGYFEGLSSERGIAWRVADSLSLRAFLDLDVTEAPPNHSTLSRTRRPVARNVWQQVEAGSPAAAARRLIMARTTRLVNSTGTSDRRASCASRVRRSSPPEPECLDRNAGWAPASRSLEFRPRHPPRRQPWATRRRA